MWLGSTPSGDEKVVAVRNRLRELVFGPGHFLEFMSESPFVTPTVTHAGGEHVPDAASVYVGWGSCALTLTPWSCPLLPDDYSTVEARQIIRVRADANDWIARLNGKELV